MAGPSRTISHARRASSQPSPSMPDIFAYELFILIILIAVPCFLVDAYFKLLHYKEIIGHVIVSSLQDFGDISIAFKDILSQFFLEAARQEIGNCIYVYYFFQFCCNHFFDFLFLVLAEISVVTITYILFDAAQAMYSSTGRQDFNKLETSVTWAAGLYAVFTTVVAIPYCYQYSYALEEYLVLSLNCVALIEALPIIAVALYTVGIFVYRSCELAKTEMGSLFLESLFLMLRYL